MLDLDITRLAADLLSQAEHETLHGEKTGR